MSANKDKGASDDARCATTHDLKCWPDYFADLRIGIKSFELRKDDRDFRVGDDLLLREWNPRTREYTGQEERRRIGYVLRDSVMVFGLRPGYAILGLAAPIPSSSTPPAPSQEKEDLGVPSARSTEWKPREAYRALRMVDDASWGEFCGYCGVLLSLDGRDEECGQMHTAVRLAHEWLERNPEVT